MQYNTLEISANTDTVYTHTHTTNLIKYIKGAVVLHLNKYSYI